MTFNKCAIEGKSYGDPIDQYGNPMDVTDVSIKHRDTVKLLCTPFVEKNIFRNIPLNILKGLFHRKVNFSEIILKKKSLQ